MLATEYDICFIRLSKYVAHLHLIESNLTWCFVQGLMRLLFKAMASKINHFSSYSDAVDYARMIKMRTVEENASLRKKRRVGEEGTSVQVRPTSGRTQSVRSQSLPGVLVAQERSVAGTLRPRLDTRSNCPQER